MTRQHDADLCERIRELEDRVKELEAKPAPSVWVGPYVWPYTAWPPATNPYQTTYTTDPVINTAMGTGRISDLTFSPAMTTSSRGS